MLILMKKKKKNNNYHIPKTLADSIPYLTVYEDGIIELQPGVYSRSYSLPDTNFQTASDQRQVKIASGYAAFIASLPIGATAELTIYNRTIDIMQFQQDVLINMKNDGLDSYREEYNSMLLKNLSASKNNLEPVKVLTVTVRSEDPDEVWHMFGQIDQLVSQKLNLVIGHNAVPLSTIERIELLNSIYNQDSTVPLHRKREIEGHESETFTLESIAKQGMTTKDLIAPDGMKFRSNDMEIGNVVARSYYISDFPTWVTASLMTDLANVPTNLLVSAYFNPIPQDKAIKLVKNTNTNIASSLVEHQKKAARSGYDASLISPETQTAKSEAAELLENMTKENERLYTGSIVITLFAPDMDHLLNYEKNLKTMAVKDLVALKSLRYQQEQGFNTSLPLGHNQIAVQRLMTSQSVGVIHPFNARELNQRGGLYYGMNAASHNMILYNRKNGTNPDGCILGMPGAGKSFAAKREIVNVLLNTDDEVYVIDPEGIDYAPLAHAFGGAEIRLSAGSKTYINPFDLNLKNADDDQDPVKVKTDFIDSICEILIGGKFGLSPIEKSIIDRCIMQLYDNYMKYLSETGKSIDPSKAPTMRDFYDLLMLQPVPEAQNIAISLERYVNGALDIFAHPTNVEINNRFTVYNIKDLGFGLKEVGLHICLDNIWNQMIANFEEGKDTWIYVDEFYLMMRSPRSAAYIEQIWKRARKWHGLPTAITQNIEDMLASREARTIINTSAFLMLLGQTELNRKQLSDMLNISPEEQKYISAAKPGMGLIRVNEEIIPMDDTFPRDTKLYQLMSTNPNERKGEA